MLRGTHTHILCMCVLVRDSHSAGGPEFDALASLSLSLSLSLSVRLPARDRALLPALRERRDPSLVG